MDEEKSPGAQNKIDDAELERRISELSQRIIKITDSPALGMADIEIGSDPDSNSTEGELANGQFLPGEELTVDNLRAELRNLELERERRKQAAA